MSAKFWSHCRILVRIYFCFYSRLPKNPGGSHSHRILSDFSGSDRIPSEFDGIPVHGNLWSDPIGFPGYSDTFRRSDPTKDFRGPGFRQIPMGFRRIQAVFPVGSDDQIVRPGYQICMFKYVVQISKDAGANVCIG